MSGKRESIEVDQDLDFQHGEWMVERTGWAVMALLVVLSLIGLFGDGPISLATLSQGDGFEFTYARFARNSSPSEIRVRLPEESNQEGQVSFWIDQKYLEGIQIDDISPEPEDSRLSSDRVTYTFATDGSTTPFEVKFDITTEISGIKTGRAGTGNGQEVRFIQVVYP